MKTVPKDLLSVLAGPWEDGTRPADLYDRAIAAKPEAYLAAVLEGLASKNKRVQGGCAELCSRISADRPDLLYPHLDVFVRALDAKAPILRWEAACTLGNLATVDDKAQLAGSVPTLIALLGNKSIVLQGHAVRALAKIARKHPRLAASIFAALSSATRFFPGTRVGYIVEAMELFAGNKPLAPAVRAFLAPHAESALAPVARKARKALRVCYPPPP